MFRRRRRDGEATTPPPEQHDDAPGRGSDAAEVNHVAPGKTDRPDGPFDAAEVDLDEARKDRIDLTGLLVKGAPGMKLQLQVDKRTGNATSAVLGVDEAAVQLVAVAAPRSSGLWEQTRLQIAADARRRGGRAEEASGPFGTEVRVVVPVKSQDGKQLLQPSRVSGIDGPRWMLRATFLGKATTDAGVFQQLVDLVRQVVVIRGSAPMPPGDVIPLKPPQGGESAQGPSEPIQT